MTIRGVNQTRACGRCGHPETRGLTGCTYCDHWIEPAALQVRSVFEFSGAIRKSIHKMKYGGEYARSEWHGAHMASLLSELGWTPDVLVAVPLHPKRQRARGYNQSQKLAEVMGQNLDLPVIPGLRRLRDTPQQALLGMEERRTNVAGAFRANQSLSGLRVLLVDDVTTTRSTLLECSRACLDDGATLVQGVTLATEV